MKCSVVGLSGGVLTVTYLGLTLGFGGEDMSKNCAPAGVAQNDYNDAKTQYEAAQNTYNGAVNSLQAANTLISDAQCAERELPTFLQKASEYCAYNSLGSYGIQVNVIGDQGPKITKGNIYSSITQWEADCQIGKDYTNLFCSDNCITWSCQRYCDADDLYCYQSVKTDSGSSCVDTRSRYQSRSCSYTRTTKTWDKFGIIAQGTGSNINSGACGQFAHSLGVKTNSNIISDLTITTQYVNNVNGKPLITEQERTIQHGSSISFAKSIPQKETVSIAVQTHASNIQLVLDSLLQFIQTNCNNAKNSIKTPEYYGRLKNSTIDKLPALQNDIDVKLLLMQATLETMNAKKSVLDSANKVCNQSLATWLPTILIPSFFLCCLLACWEKQNRENDYVNARTLDTEQKNCGCPPILFSKSKRQPRDNHNPTPRFNETNSRQFNYINSANYNNSDRAVNNDFSINNCSDDGYQSANGSTGNINNFNDNDVENHEIPCAEIIGGDATIKYDTARMVAT